MFKRVRDQWGLVLIGLACAMTVYLGLQARQKTIIRLIERGEVSDAFGALYSNSSYGFAIMRDDHRIVAWNKAMVNLTGYTKAEINQWGLSVLMGPDDKIKHAEAMKCAIDKQNFGETTVIDCNCHTKSGQLVPIRVSVRIAETDLGRVYMIANMDKQDNLKKIKGQNQ